MPACSRCLEVRPIEEFSDAQLYGKRKCLRCSNPRLHAKKVAAETGACKLSLSDVGRSRLAAPPADGLRACSSCRKLVPIASYSARQLNGKGNCPSCAKRASEANLARQADQGRKRQRDDLLLDLSADDDSEDEAYAAELLRGVEEARRHAQANERPMEQAGADVAIDEANPGHRMLQRMGWSPGDGLGARNHGRVDPPAPPSQIDKRGLGLGTEDKAAGARVAAAAGDGAAEPANPGSARAVHADELVWRPHRP